jgi:hypothetical protein
VATWKTVCEVALALPDTEESSSYRRPSFKVRGKWLTPPAAASLLRLAPKLAASLPLLRSASKFTGMSPHEEDALVVRVDPGERELLLASRPDLYYVTPHYAGWPMLLVRLAKIGRRDLRERIEDSYELTTSRVKQRR